MMKSLIDHREQSCQETISQGKTSSGQGRQIDRSALKNLVVWRQSRQINGKIAVRQGVKVPSPGIFAWGCTTTHATYHGRYAPVFFFLRLHTIFNIYLVCIHT